MGIRMVEIFFTLDDLLKVNGQGQTLKTLKSKYLEIGTRPCEAERRLCRPEDELTGRQSSVRYSGAAPTIQCRTRRAILNRMRSPIGSQWSSLRMAAETLPNLGIPQISLAAEFRTD